MRMYAVTDTSKNPPEFVGHYEALSPQRAVLKAQQALPYLVVINLKAEEAESE